MNEFRVGYRKKGCKTCGSKVFSYDSKGLIFNQDEISLVSMKQIVISTAENGFTARFAGKNYVFRTMEEVLAFVESSLSEEKEKKTP